MSAGVSCVPVKAALMLGESPRKRLPFYALGNGCVNGFAGHFEITALQASEAVRLCCIKRGAPAPRKYFTIAGQILGEAIGLGACA